MNGQALYDSACLAASGEVVRLYSTSFSHGIRALHPRFRGPIKAIYAFVRFADEIVDTFLQHDRTALLERFASDTYGALDEGLSMNPVLHAFQGVVRCHGIPPALVDTFLHSMRMDLLHTTHNERTFTEYVTGSAEAVGLMCLRVFCEDDDLYQRLSPAARRLGAAFQKINFLRDLKDDHEALGRSYFPQLDPRAMDAAIKKKLELDIEADLQAALPGIRALPKGARFGVYVAYRYYRALFRKIQGSPPERILLERIRLHDRRKLALVTTSYLRYSFGFI